MTRLTHLLLAAATVILLTAAAGLQTVKIQTTAVCGMCKDRIEGVLSAVEGVKSARLDLTTKKVKIKYDDALQSESSLRAIIAQIGYGADEVPADQAAHEALPGCCQAGGTACAPGAHEG